MNIVGKFISAWTRPFGAMNDVKMEGESASITPSIIFVVVMGLLNGLITAIIGTIKPSAAVAVGASKAMVWSAVLIMPAVALIGSFIAAFIIWGLIDGVLRGTMPQYKTAYRLLAILAAFSPVTALLAAIPGNITATITIGQVLGFLVNIWATIVMIQGIIIVCDTPKVRTWVTCIVLFGFLFALGLMARVAANQQLQAGGGLPEFGAAGGATDDLALDEGDQLDKQLDSLADKAKAAPAAPKK